MCVTQERRDGVGQRAAFDTGLSGNAMSVKTRTQRDSRAQRGGKNSLCTSLETGKSWPVPLWEHRVEREGWRDLRDDAGKTGRPPIWKGLGDHKEKYGCYSQHLGKPQEVFDHRVYFL